MDIDISDFSPFQQRVLLDLYVLALEADGQLPAASDARLDSLFKLMGCGAEAERQREFEASVARMKPHAHPVQKARDQLIALSQAFTSRPQHKKVYAAMQKMFAGDAHVSNVEIQLLSELRLRFRV
jgi:hypothetical protein